MVLLPAGLADLEVHAGHFNIVALGRVCQDGSAHLSGPYGSGVDPSPRKHFSAPLLLSTAAPLSAPPAKRTAWEWEWRRRVHRLGGRVYCLGEIKLRHREPLHPVGEGQGSVMRG